MKKKRLTVTWPTTGANVFKNLKTSAFLQVSFETNNSDYGCASLLFKYHLCTTTATIALINWYLYQ